ncbi:MAG: peptidoglycan-binding domain-containing protein [Fibrobacteria bacterium]
MAKPIRSPLAPSRPAPTIVLSHASLEKLFTAFHVHPQKDGLVLFALRGALPAKVAAGWARSVQVRNVPVDYVHMRCTLGIWDRAGQRVFAAPGSTVPYRDNVEKAAARKGRTKGKGTNQLEPGFYTDLTKGEHLQGKLNGHEALRQTGYRLYRRSLSGVPYRDSGRGKDVAPLFYGNPYDNLHCGWNENGKGPGFSSAGCLVVAGMPHCPRREDQTANLGPWKIFHDLIYAVDQKRFPLLLLPAEATAAALAAAEKPSSRGGSVRLVYGSEGEEVKALQRRLAAQGDYRGRATGLLDARTYKAWRA